MANRVEVSTSGPSKMVVTWEEAAVGQALLSVWYEDFKFTSGGNVMYTLPVDHFVKMQVAYVDAKGNPAAIDGLVSWASSDPSVATVDTDPTDSTIVTVTPVGPVGQVQITATADADLGAGVKSLVTTADVTIAAGEAVAGTISPVGPAEPIPA